MKRSHLVLCLGLLAALVSAPAPAAAQADAVRSDPSGFHLGAFLNGSALTIEDEDDTESGGGLSLELGYGFNRTFSLYAKGTGAAVEYADFDDTYQLGHFDLGARVNLGGPQRSVLGFLVGGISGRAAVLDLGEDLTLTGLGPTLGGGVSVFLNPSFALEGGLLFTFGEFTEAEYSGFTEDVEIGATSARLDLGIHWWAGR